MRLLVSIVLAFSMFAFLSTAAFGVNVPTGFGVGADAEIANDEVAIDPETGEPNPTNQFYADDALGLGGGISMRMFQDDLFFTIIRHRVGLFRFDLSGVEGDFSDAHFEFHSTNQGRTLDIYALNDTDSGAEDWDEATITYNTAPGFQDINPLPTGYVALDEAAVSLIGTWAVPGPNSGDGFPVNFTVVSRPTPTEGAEPGKVYADTIMPEFAQSLSNAIEADTNGSITLLFVHTGAADPAYQGNNGNVGVLSKEGLAEDMAAEEPLGYFLEPSLVLPNATEIPAGGLAGDYNDDGVVDASDYVLWRDNLGGDGSVLANRDSGASGPVGEADYAAWRAQYGTTDAAAGAIAAPEPSSFLLFAVCSVGCGALCRSRV